MSQESPDLRAMAEAAFGALNSGDLDGFLAVATEDVEFTSLVAEVEGTTFQGHDGIRTWWETVRGAFGNVHWDVLEVRGYGGLGGGAGPLGGTPGGGSGQPTMWV